MAEPSYCNFCRTCGEETKTAEDLSYHLMNNHQPQEVLGHYRKKFIEEQHYCIHSFQWSQEAQARLRISTL
jgi:hypothetical protein